MGKKLGKSEKSSLAGVDFGEFDQGYGVSKNIKGPKKTPMALFRVILSKKLSLHWQLPRKSSCCVPMFI